MHVYRKLGAGRVPAAVLLTTVQCAPWGRLRVFKQVPQHTFAMQIHYRGKGNCPQLTEIEAELAKLVLYSNRWASWSSFSFPVFKMLSSTMQSSTFPPPLARNANHRVNSGFQKIRDHNVEQVPNIIHNNISNISSFTCTFSNIHTDLEVLFLS